MRAASLLALVLAAATGVSRLAHADPTPVEVTVNADAPHVVLEKRESVTQGWQLTVVGFPTYVVAVEWRQVCVAPCTVELDPSASYRANGDGVATSSSFELPPGKNEVKLKVHARSSFWYGTGIALTATGGPLALLGAAGLFVAPSLTDSSAEKTLRGFGGSLLGAGVLMMIVGLPLWLGGSSTVSTVDAAPRD